jgi:hypothetical protein
MAMDTVYSGLAHGTRFAGMLLTPIPLPRLSYSWTRVYPC